MKGILIGDLVGSVYEGRDLKGYTLPLISPQSQLTDDSIVALGTAEAYLNKVVAPEGYAQHLREWVIAHPERGYGPDFQQWACDTQDECAFGSSGGNGAAIRAAILGLLCNNEADLFEAIRSAVRITHSEDALEMANAVGMAVRMAKNGMVYPAIRERLRNECFVEIECDLADLHENMGFSTSMEETVPPALYIGLKADTPEQALRQALYIGGDTDTIAAIAGAVIDARNLRWPLELIRKVEEKIRNLDFSSRAQAILDVLRDDYDLGNIDNEGF